MRGERWKDIPGLEGFYVISNFGRVKRCPYERQYRNGAIHSRKEKVIRLSLVKNPSKSKGDKNVFLAVKLTRSKRRYYFTVARLVYYCFVEPMDLADDTTLIVAVDGDDLNIRPENLRAVRRVQGIQRKIDRKAFDLPIHDLEDSVKAEMQKNIVRIHEKQVSQYDVTGKRIASFVSLADAQRATGISYVNIRGVANGGHIRAGGYFWRWGKEDKIDVTVFLAARRKEKRLRKGFKVTQYTLTGKRIAQFLSLGDAVEATGASGHAIRQVITGKFKSAKGYLWKEGHGPEEIDLTGYKWGGSSAAEKLNKRVAQYNLSGEYIKTFESIKAAAAAVKLNKSFLSAASRGLLDTCGGWRWKFV
jgi:hypothetical protein